MRAHAVYNHNHLIVSMMPQASVGNDQAPAHTPRHGAVRVFFGSGPDALPRRRFMLTDHQRPRRAHQPGMSPAASGCGPCRVAVPFFELRLQRPATNAASGRSAQATAAGTAVAGSRLCVSAAAGACGMSMSTSHSRTALVLLRSQNYNILLPFPAGCLRVDVASRTLTRHLLCNA